LKIQILPLQVNTSPEIKNSHADSLATLVSAVDFQFRHEIPVEYIPEPSIHKSDEEVLL